MVKTHYLKHLATKIPCSFFEHQEYINLKIKIKLASLKLTDLMTDQDRQGDDIDDTEV